MLSEIAVGTRVMVTKQGSILTGWKGDVVKRDNLETVGRDWYEVALEDPYVDESIQKVWLLRDQIAEVTD